MNKRFNDDFYVSEISDYVASQILEEIFLACGCEPADFFSAKKRAEEHYAALKCDKKRKNRKFGW